MVSDMRNNIILITSITHDIPIAHAQEWFILNKLLKLNIFYIYTYL